MSFPASESANNALLLATIPSLDPPHFLSSIIHTAAATTKYRLAIVLFSRLFNAPHSPRPGLSRTHHWEDVHRLLTYVYVQATKVAHDLDKLLMDIDVLLLGIDSNIPDDLGNPFDIVFRVAGDSIAIPLPSSISSIRQSFLPSTDSNNSIHHSSPISPNISLSHLPSQQPPLYDVVALGGTFDHLHPGHKILLSLGAWIAHRKIIVGVTADSLLQKKANKHILQHIDTRIARVRAFLQLFRPGIEYQIVPLHDVYGPTAIDPDIQALVVSRETVSGAQSIATRREEKNLPPLQTFVIDVISADSEKLDHEDMEMLRRTKMSSTVIREWIVERSKQEEEARV